MCTIEAVPRPLILRCLLLQKFDDFLEKTYLQIASKRERYADNYQVCYFSFLCSTKNVRSNSCEFGSLRATRKLLKISARSLYATTNRVSRIVTNISGSPKNDAFSGFFA